MRSVMVFVTTGVIVFPQASVTTGAVGATASDGQFTVLAPLTGNVKSGAAIVYV
jgi:hypothetical protein